MRRAIQKGFTLIELVVVIVILGILAAIAVPQFTDLATSARTAVGEAACGALQSSAVLLYASNKQGHAMSSIIANTQYTGGTYTNGGCGASATSFTPTGGTAVPCAAAIPAALCTGP